MTKEILIDGRPVSFRASAGIPRMYRMIFRRDVFADMMLLAQDIQNKSGLSNKAEGYSPCEMVAVVSNLSADSLTVFENIVYVMAKHADPQNVPGTPDEWLEQFEILSIYDVLPEIMELWAMNAQTISDSKKKFVQ